MNDYIGCIVLATIIIFTLPYCTLLEMFDTTYCNNNTGVYNFS
jgi:hypothetical protein